MEEFSKEELEQLHAIFREQSIEIIGRMDQALLALEANWEDAEAIGELRRAAHTLKGDSYCIGLSGIAEIAHRIEDLFDSLLCENKRLAREPVDVILEALDGIRAALNGEHIVDLDPEVARQLTERLSPAAYTGDHEEVAAPAATDVAAPHRFDPDPEPAQRKSQFVRVEAAKIDALLRLAGEMVIARSAMNQACPELDRLLPKNEVAARIVGVNSQTGKLIGEFQKTVLKLRMGTVGDIFKRFRRPMRELAAESGKSVQIEMEGAETEIDRAIIDLLYEPLLHLLRNAVDHGLETAEERKLKGKAETGKIVMRAYHEASQVVIEVSDDGGGMDPGELRAKAVETGLLPESEAAKLSDEEAFELIFVPGFSTSDEITRISGRGIGADAVKSSVEQMHGSIGLKSEIGKGTTFFVRVPLTLAIIRGLLFTAGGRLFALPILAVRELARIQAADIVCFDGFESIRLRDHFISLVRPGAILGYERRKGGAGSPLRSEARTSFVIVLKSRDKSYGIMADSLLGEQELVIKPLDSPWLQNDVLTGASVLGDGRVVLILDAEMVFRKALKYERFKGVGRVANG